MTSHPKNTNFTTKLGIIDIFRTGNPVIIFLQLNYNDNLLIPKKYWPIPRVIFDLLREFFVTYCESWFILRGLIAGDHCNYIKSLVSGNEQITFAWWPIWNQNRPIFLRPKFQQTPSIQHISKKTSIFMQFCKNVPFKLTTLFPNRQLKRGLTVFNFQLLWFIRQNFGQ
jgi:hypothetical protein